MYADANSLYGYAMNKKLPLVTFSGEKIVQYLLKIILKITMKIVTLVIY